MKLDDAACRRPFTELDAPSVLQRCAKSGNRCFADWAKIGVMRRCDCEKARDLDDFWCEHEQPLLCAQACSCHAMLLAPAVGLAVSRGQRLGKDKFARVGRPRGCMDAGVTAA